ncbi:MAG: hypothetical protein J5860_06325, partial [Clostridia bacterium]|nr:hypothetical protein [Clostridia bacterium]
MTDSIEKFSPSGKIKMPPQSRNSISREAYASDSAPVPSPVDTRATSRSDDFTRSLPAQSAPAERTSMDTLSVEPSETLRGAFRKTTQMQPPPASSFLTTGLNTYEVNHRIGKITKNMVINMSSIAAGGLHSAVVFSSGRVKAFGMRSYGQCNVENWGNIVSVAAGNHHTVGLCENGTCVATGYNGYGQCDVGSWTNICQVAAGVGHTVGLCENGTCVAVGDNTYGQCNVFDWTEIVAVVAGNNFTVGLKADGTITAVGANTEGQWAAYKW